MTADKEALLAICDDLQELAERAALEIARLAELPLQEVASAALLKEVLVREGFAIEREFPQIPNAFVASAGSGRPVIGLLAEYDALPDCGVGGKGPGHGCGHNLLGAAATYAAVASARQLLASGRAGTVKLFGCPAEETLVGKVYMARDGAFDGLDACLAWHPGGNTNVNNGSGAAMDSLTYEFFGRTAHAAGDPHNGRSALDAVEIMNVAVNFLREHVPSNVRIHYAIMDGGKAPNVVPAYARSWYYIRGENRDQVADISTRVHHCARGAAMASGTTMKRRILTAVYDRLPNDSLARALDANLRTVGPPDFGPDDLQLARDLGVSGDFADSVGEISTSKGFASSDEANVSWIAPMAVLSVACWAQRTPGHHHLIHQQATLPAAMKGLAVAIKVLGLTVWDLLTDETLLADARRELDERLAGRSYDPIIPAKQKPPLQDQIP